MRGAWYKNMIQINLLPEELKKRKRKLALPAIPILPIAAGVVGFLVALQLILTAAIFIGKAQLGFLEKRWKTLEPKKNEIDAIKKKISAKSREAQSIESLKKSALNWSRLLDELSSSLTANVWLAELSYDEKIDGKIAKGILRISGMASGRDEKGTAHIARFIQALKDNPGFYKDFSGIELISIRKDVFAGQDAMRFTISCEFKSRQAE